MLYADANAISLTARRNGTFSSQDTAIRLDALGNGLIQFFRNGANLWTIDASGHLVPNGSKNIGSASSPVTTLSLLTSLSFFNSGTIQSSIKTTGQDVLTFEGGGPGALPVLEFSAGGPKLFVRSASPEGNVTAPPGSLVLDSTHGRQYLKESGVGNTGWVDRLSGGVKSYRALLTQTGTSAPTVTVLENTLGGTVVWTRVGPGDYWATLTGAFPANKVQIFMGSSYVGGTSFVLFQMARLGANDIQLVTKDVDLSSATANESDDLMTDTAITMLVYP